MHTTDSPLPAPPARILVIVNPEAGASDPAKVLEKIQVALASHRVPFEIYTTSPDTSVPQVIQQAVLDGFDLFIAAGGDGTVSQTASGLAGLQIPMAILPLGTGNIIAKDLHVPLRLSEALDLVFKPHKLICIDGLKVGSDYFFLNVSFGFSANIFKHVDRREKKRLGIFYYVWKILLQLVGVQPVRFTLIVDGRRISVAASDVMVANTVLIGMHPFALDPDARMDDGKLSACVIRARNVFDYLRIAWNVLMRRTKIAREVQWIDVQQRIEVRSQRVLPVQGDGDIIGVTPVEVEFVPGLVRVIVPLSYR